MLLRGDYEEKRLFTRMVVDCPTVIRIDDEEATYHAVVHDLSATGLQVNCEAPLPVGARIVLVMTPEKQSLPPLQARAEVLRCDECAGGGYRLGLTIIEMVPGL